MLGNDVDPVRHALPVEQLLRHFELDPRRGLDVGAVRHAQARHGPNRGDHGPGDRGLRMIDLQTLGMMAGGLGLFLLGMGLMTDGLKLAAGPALHRILAGATRTRAHALGSGMLVTALVQSSSAITVATIGFVNAGLLALGPALWVLFGANVGTTRPGGCVALGGRKFKGEALAMPLAGLGALLRLTGEGRRSGAIGTALAGFGLLFMGIALLQQAFAGLAGQVSLPQGEGAMAVLAQMGIGAVMTVLMQSSSAAMAHVVFNLLTGIVALLLLPWLIPALGQAREALSLPPDPAAKLALFHTTFNLLGVLLMWPLAARLTRWLQQRFRAREEDEAQAQFLDDTVLAVPTLALDALTREIHRAGQVAVRMSRAALAGADAAAIRTDHTIHASLDRAIEHFVERLREASMSQTASARLAELLRIQRYQETAAEQSLAAAAWPIMRSTDAPLAAARADFVAAADTLLARCDPSTPEDTPALDGALHTMEARYEDLKAALLAAGAAARLPLTDMEQALRHGSALRRAAQQLHKARRRAADRDPAAMRQG
jgi:phosphate:Na+ symporter